MSDYLSNISQSVAVAPADGAVPYAWVATRTALVDGQELKILEILASSPNGRRVEVAIEWILSETWEPAWANPGRDPASYYRIGPHHGQGLMQYRPASEAQAGGRARGIYVEIAQPPILDEGNTYSLSVELAVYGWRAGEELVILDAGKSGDGTAPGDEAPDTTFRRRPT